jgi:hypothetical protein
VEAHAGEVVGVVEEALGVGGRKLHDLGDEERLGGDARLVHLALELLVDEAFVGRVLVHDDDAGGRLGDDVVGVDLRAGGAERAFGRLGFRGEDAGGEAAASAKPRATGRGAGRSIW